MTGRPRESEQISCPVAPRHPVALLLLALGLVSACAVAPENSTYTNEGGLCVVSGPDGRVRARVTFPECLSSSCDHPVVALCEIKMQDGAILVSSRGELAHEGGACTADCGSFTADCASAPIPPGTYVVHYGTQETGITLPTSQMMLFSSNNGFESCPQ